MAKSSSLATNLILGLPTPAIPEYFRVVPGEGRVWVGGVAQQFSDLKHCLSYQKNAFHDALKTQVVPFVGEISSLLPLIQQPSKSHVASALSLLLQSSSLAMEDNTDECPLEFAFFPL